MSAIDRATPKKVKPYENMPVLRERRACARVVCCGTCGSDAIYSDDLAELKFCGDCGQALDWSEAVAEEME